MGQFGVATWSFEVATWGRLPGRVTTSARPTLAVCVTCARPVGCARSSAHDLGTARAVCARLGFWVCALCTQPSFVTRHCSGHYLNIVHRVFQKKKKKDYKIFKNVVVYDLKYEILILKLL